MLALATACSAAAAALASGPIGRRPPRVRAATPVTERTSTAGELSGPPKPPSARFRPPLAIWSIWLIWAFVVAVIGTCFGLAAACITIIGTVTAHRARQRAAIRRWRNAQRADAQEILWALATELEAGRNPSDALRTAVEDLGRDDADAGRPLLPRYPRDTRTRVSDSLALRTGLAHRADPATMLARCEAATLRQLAAAWRVSQIAGIPLAPMANRLATVIRDEREKDGEVSAALAGPRASGRLVASLPLAGIGLGVLIGASPLDVLLHTPAGTACLAIGIALDLAGLAWINRLTEQAGAHAGSDQNRYGARPMTAEAS